MVAPGPPEQPLQWIDARDLAAFVLRLCEEGTAGTFDVATPPRRHSLVELLEATAGIAGSSLEVDWLDEGFVRAQGLVVTEQDDPFPLITPDEPNGHLFDTSRAVASGLTFRPLRDTAHDTLAWDRQRGFPPLVAGLREGREAELLAIVDGAA
jgi:2'-hydroxyisoflavone reductase